jgi:aspartyl-tRNA(Asn)/glutamyl-tRNA(Gln) amidotransferase subunit A
MSGWSSIADLSEQVRSGKVTASQLVEKALATIEEKKEFNAVIAVVGDRARDRAKQIDNDIKEGKEIGRLAGVPFIAKDNLLTFGSETTAASNILKGFTAPYQATVIESIEAEGGICVAKANLDAFAHGASTENSDFMVTKNPKDPTKVPGGSSGGPAAAVILEMAPFALGTDTGGSIRQPASFCGAVGYKPTYGLVSRNGAVAMASSTDVIGPLTKTVEDSALILDIIAGKDRYDGTTIDRDVVAYTELDSKNSITVGVVKEHNGEGVDPGVKASIDKAIASMKSNGIKIIDVSLPSLSLALACYYIICPAEISSNLSRYDGQRYGFSEADARSLDDSYNMSRTKGFGKEAKRRIMIGTYVLSSGYYDAYYKQAQKLRTKLIEEFNEAFSKCDFLIGPVSPTVAFEIGGKINDPLQMYLSDIMTVGASLVGIPAISIPASESEGLPVGLQIMAPQKHDRQLLSAANFIEGVL